MAELKMMTKDTDLIEIVKPYAKDQVSQEIILGELNRLRPEEDGVYRTFPAALDAIQKIKATFRFAVFKDRSHKIYDLIAVTTQHFVSNERFVPTSNDRKHL